MEDELRELSLTDELTGLHNRRGFALLAEQAANVAQRMRRKMVLFFFDLDNLKTINDAHGHPEGDAALQEVATILKTTFREADICARFGGDEFVVLAQDASMESAELLAKRIRAELKGSELRANRPYVLTLSMGIVGFDPEAPRTVAEMIADADALMYRQKASKKAGG